MKINLRNLHIETMPIQEFFSYAIDKTKTLMITDELKSRFGLKGSDAIFLRDLKFIEDRVLFICEWGFEEQ